MYSYRSSERKSPDEKKANPSENFDNTESLLEIDLQHTKCIKRKSSFTIPDERESKISKNEECFNEKESHKEDTIMEKIVMK